MVLYHRVNIIFNSEKENRKGLLVSSKTELQYQGELDPNVYENCGLHGSETWMMQSKEN